MKRTASLVAVLLLMAFSASARDRDEMQDASSKPFAKIVDCHGVLNERVIEQANGTVDPAVAFKDAHPGTTRMPASVRCASRVWEALHTPAPLTRQRAQVVDGPRIAREKKQQAAISKTLKPQVDDNNGNGNGNGNGNNGNGNGNGKKGNPPGKPTELSMKHAGSSHADLRTLPQTRPEEVERPEVEEPMPAPTELEPDVEPESRPVSSLALTPQINAPAPAPSIDFDGLDFANFGNGHPPDTNGDVGPQYYIQTINTSLGIFDKATGTRVAAFSFNTFMHQGNFGNLCDTNNFGDPVVLYDTFEGRWIVTDFAFQLTSGGAVINPPGAFQCVAVSMNGDPVSGGWNFYSINTAGGLGDYPKFGIWPDGLYMSANMFTYAGTAFQNPRVYAFNKAQMYAGSPSVQVVTFDAPAADFALLPSNARLQTGTPPPGTPNYFVSTWLFTNALSVYKMHVDWDRISLSSFTGPFNPIMSNSWPNASVPNAASLGGNALDVLQIRAMMQNQYTNLGGVESLWTSHTVRRANTTGLAAPRFYQVNVNGAVVASTTTQSATFDPDGANVISRFMPSVAVDRAGNMALGYSTSSSTTKPAIKYAGRLATDAPGTISQTEQLLIQGTGTQTGNCGSSACIRWGDYSAMSLDPDGCTFWYTSQYYKVDGLNHQTHIGSFRFAPCTMVGGGGSLSGTVAVSGGGAPIAGATVTLGSRVATTNGAGVYAFLNLPAGNYPILSVTAPGYTPATVSSVVINDSATTTRNFSLAASAISACLTDTSQSDFQRGIPANVDLITVPGDVTLVKPDNIDQQNTTVTNSGFAVNNTAWAGQTFVAGLSGPLVKADLDLFCSGCTGTIPNLTLSVRAVTGGLPAGPDLATATIPGFSSGSGGFFSATFSTPFNVTAGTAYAVVLRASANPSAGTYAYVCSCAGTGTINSNPYANGLRVTSGNSGGTWTADATVGGRDLGFRVYVNTGYAPSGNLVSGLMDANPATTGVPTWSTLSWTGATPAGTSLGFQVAASNLPTGPFTFVGPDGTAGSSFTTSGASLSQFNGKRYLKYAATLGSTNSTVTPTLNDVTACYIVMLPSALTAAPASGVYGGAPVTLTATLSSNGNPVGGKQVSFAIDGTSAGSATSDATGLATLTNVSIAAFSAGSHNIVATFSGDSFYASSTASNTLTLDKATATINVTAYSVTYDGNAHTAAGTATGVSGELLNGLVLTGTTHTNAGTYNNDPWTFTDVTGNYNNASGTVNDAIGKADATIVVTAYNVTYNGDPHTATGTATGAKGESLTGFDLSATTHTNAGAYNNEHWTFTDVTGNYNNASGSVNDNIDKAAATVSVTGYGVPYDGNPHTATGSVKGVKGETLTGLDLSATTHVNAGSYTDSWTFTDVTGNYNNASGTVTDSIGKVGAASITINGYTGVYDGLAHGATGSATGVNGENLSGLLTIGPAFTNVPGGVANWVFAGDNNYSPASGTANVVITAAPLTVTANGASRLYGFANPTFTASYSGFKNNETLATSGVTGSPSLTTTATQFSAAGPYTITAALGTLSANNYSFNFVNGTMTVFLSGIVGLDSASIGANKAVADSYDSSVGYPAGVSSNVQILSNGAIEVTGAKISGNLISSQGAIHLASGSQVSGNVTAGTTISNQGTVGGTLTPNSPSAPIVANAVADCGAFTLNPAISGGKYSYSNGDLTVNGSSALTLGNGAYCFHNVSVTGNSTIQVSGPVTLNVTGTLTVSGGGFVNSTLIPSNLQIASSYTGADGVKLTGNSNMYMTVYAPGTNVTLTGGSGLFGAFLGKTLTIGGNSQVHYDVLLPQIWAGFGF